MKNEFQSLIKTNSPASKKSLKDTVLMYLYYWPFFLLSLLLSLGAAYTFIRYSVPKYSANTIINVKGETTASKSSQGPGDLITTAMNGGRSVINLDNELGRLRSARLMAQVVRKGELNISYLREGRFVETNIHTDAPFRLLQKDIQDSSAKIRMSVTNPSAEGFTLKYGSEDNPTTKKVGWNQVFLIRNNAYVLAPLSSNWNTADKYIVEWSPVFHATYDLMPKVSVNPIGKTSNIALSVTIENKKLGEDVLNRMVDEFIVMNLDDQNRFAQEKIYFIEDRLGKISTELKGVEKNLAGFQSQNMMVGNEVAGGYNGESVAAANKAISELQTQKSIMNLIRNSLSGPNAESTALPSGGVTDGVLSSLIGSYNEIVIKRQREAPLVAPNSMILKDLDMQLQTLKSNILDNLNANAKALDIQSSSFARQGNVFRSTVSVVPEKQRVLNEIVRDKSIMENLYVYLLQKREETALSKTSTTPYEQIDRATSYGPVSPNKKNIYLYAVVLGLAVPVLIIFIINMVNDKIRSREEVENTAIAQVVGEISNIKKSEDKLLPSVKGGLVGEQFRIMRANLSFLQQQAKKQVILITSSESGEGKSFVSLNLAAVLSKTGKQVALLDFDLRKPDESMPATISGKGIKDYLLGEATLKEIVQQVGELPSLHLYPSGSIIAEAGDLIVSERVEQLIDELLTTYDSIVINTPPVGLVGDALILQRYSTIVGFVIREGQTRKKHVTFLNSLIETKKFTNACLIYNGVKTGMKYGYYGYGYTKNNSYFDRNGQSKTNGLFKRRKKATV